MRQLGGYLTKKEIEDRRRIGVKLAKSADRVLLDFDCLSLFVTNVTENQTKVKPKGDVAGTVSRATGLVYCSNQPLKSSSCTSELTARTAVDTQLENLSFSVMLTRT